MIKQGEPPVPLDLLARAREELARDYGFEVTSSGGRSVLIARVPRHKPDPPADLEILSFSVDENEAGGVMDVLLVGDERVVGVNPVTLRDVVRDRDAEDEDINPHLQARLDPAYDLTVFRHVASPHHLRVGVRVPRRSVTEINEEDLDNLRRSLAPLLNSPKAGEVRAFHIVADDDAARLSPDALRSFLATADEPAPAAPPEATGPQAGLPAGVVLEPPADAVPSASTEALDEEVTETFEVPAEAANAVPADDGAEILEDAPTTPASLPSSDETSPAAPRSLPNPARAARRRLEEAGYEVLVGIPAGEIVLDLAAHRDGGPRLLVHTVDWVDADVVRDLAKLVESLKADALLCLAGAIVPGAREAAWGTSVVLHSAARANELRP